ncbi:hypothetical protein AHF37_01236 [Paragonimus kellicotti]|nr:hypothetical protein AHF37_01236 [Paragonimus kellicotti]
MGDILKTLLVGGYSCDAELPSGNKCDLDPAGNIIRICDNSRTASNGLTVIEYCAYTPSTTIPPTTLITRSLSIESKLNSTIRSPLTYFLSHRYRSAAKASLSGYEYVCHLHDTRTVRIQTDSSISSRSKVSETIKTVARNRSREIREFSNARPRVVMADSGSLDKN